MEVTDGEFGWEIMVLWVYVNGMLITASLLLTLAVISYCLRLVFTFRFYIEHGEYQNFDLDQDHAHPGQDAALFGMEIVKSFALAIVWPPFVVYVMYHGSACALRARKVKRDKFMSKLSGKEEATW